jgi:nitrous-oxide reductase
MGEQLGDQVQRLGNKRLKRRTYLGGLGAALALPASAALLSGCSRLSENGLPTSNATAEGGLPAEALDIIAKRKLSPDDVSAALSTFLPSGRLDDYLMFASGGQSGQVLVIGLPSMRLLKVIAVFTPESWQGYGFSDDTKSVLNEGKVEGRSLTWGDTHHPALSETNGDYDGKWLFINDKANSRMAVIDLRDFSTKQIVKNPLLLSDHGGTFVTPNTEYVLEGSQYGMPLGWEYAPISEYKEKYRGLLTLWKFDRQNGRIVPEESFGIEVPPYGQDLADAGKLASDGWAFWNSFNTEMATGGDLQGKPPLEMGASQRDMDYMHIVNWKKAEQVVKAGNVETIKGLKVIRIPTAIREGILYLLPEPKSPHGVDVTPKGDYIVVAGKLDPHVTVYSFEKIQLAIQKGIFEKDEYGIPILPFKDCVEAQVEVGLGPLHTQFDDQGYAYTSLFLDSAVSRWSLGKPYRDDGWKAIEKVPVQYNVGHVAAVAGDTVKPLGGFLVALNKWSVDRFANIGPLLPQNLQLLDIAKDHKMRVLYDLPIGNAEPHYAQIIPTDRIKAWDKYPEIGWNAITQSKDPNATILGKERIERNGNKVEIWMTSVRSHFTPDQIEVTKGDQIVWHITNNEKARDATHGFALPLYDVNLSLEPGKTETISFVADTSGTFPFYCTEFCSALHLEMMGYFLVKPST